MNVEDLYRLLRTGHVQAQGIVDTIADPMLVLDSSLCVQSASRAFFDTFQVDRYETIGRPLYELGNGQWDIPELRSLLTEVIPKATALVNYKVEHVFPSLGRRTMLLTARTLHHPDRASHSLLLVVADVTERAQQEAAKDLLFGEIQHRIKNLLSVARSLARHTSTEGRTAEEYRDAFLGRFEALINAQEMAFAEQEEWDLADLVNRILAPYATRPDAVAIESGAPVHLGPRQTQSLGLVLHELATNAAKYGALSAADGIVQVSWQIKDGTNLHLRWAERGGPPVTAPTRTGFGTELIQSMITYDLGGRLEQVFDMDGYGAEIVIPLGSAPLPD